MTFVASQCASGTNPASGFSAHADAGQLVDWLRDVPEPRTAFVVHGEPASAQTLASRLRTELGWTAVVPRFEERVRVG